MSTARRPRHPSTPPNTHGPVGTTYVSAATLPADVAATLRRARERLGWSIRRAGRELGTPHTTVLRLEKGERAPSTAMAEEIARVYQLDWVVADRLHAVSLPGVGRSSPRRRETTVSTRTRKALMP